MSAQILQGPLLPLLVRQALPTVAVMFLVTLLSVAETYFVSGLGTDAVAAASLVVPVLLLMTMVSNGGIGGGVSAAIARARGAGRMRDAESLAWHAVVLAVAFGAAFTLVLWAAGPAIYSALGGRDESLRQALVYSDILFGGAVLSWVFMLLQAALRGAGHPALPARVATFGVLLGLVLSPALILGWGPLPRLGVAGAGVAQVVTNAISVAIVVRSMRPAEAVLRLVPAPLEREKFLMILRIGLPSSVNAVLANLALTALTAAAGVSGVAAVAGFGIASRLDALLVPVFFGFGTAALTIVGYNLGAGQVGRARRAALVNAFAVAAGAEALGLVFAWRPSAWLSLFSSDAGVLSAGASYLHTVAPAYGALALSMELYFAGQGAGRIGWPMVATSIRLACSIAAAALAVQGKIELQGAFVLAAAGMVLSAAVTLAGFAVTDWGRRHGTA